MARDVKRMATELDAKLDSLSDELILLKHETDRLTEGFRNEEIIAMENGEPNEMASDEEAKARENFARIREIEQLLNTHHGN